MSIKGRKRGKYKRPRPVIAQPSDTSVRLIPLTQDQVTVVDAEDFEWLNQWNWQAARNGDRKAFYAERTAIVEGRHIRLLMHRVLMKALPGNLVDHRSRNTLDNRKSNLRTATGSQNAINSKLKVSNKSGYRGVSWHKGTQRWTARIATGEKRKSLGYFSSAEEASKAYVAAEKVYHGEFAPS